VRAAEYVDVFWQMRMQCWVLWFDNVGKEERTGTGFAIWRFYV
jgi:hypothetical protein